MFGSLVNKHSGNVAIFDDHWTAKHHKPERMCLIEDLQDLAAEKSVRVTILRLVAAGLPPVLSLGVWRFLPRC